MNYKETTSWMFSKLPMYQSHGKSAYKEDLHRTELLVSHLKNPHHNFKSVHVGGTNGKGSTCHMIASVLQNSGYKVGLYTSPHLKDFRERIRINGNKISKKSVVNFIQENKSFLELAIAEANNNYKIVQHETFAPCYRPIINILESRKSISMEF